MLADMMNTLQLQQNARSRYKNGQSIATHVTLRLFDKRIKEQQFCFTCWQVYAKYSKVRFARWAASRVGVLVERVTHVEERAMKKPRAPARTLDDFSDATGANRL